MDKWRLLLLFVLVLVFTPGKAQAQQIIELDRVQISIWPEYDRPDVLVMYDLTLSSQTSLPASLQVRIPRSVGQPYAVAMRSIDGGLSNMAFDTRIAGDWLVISFTTPTQEVRLEYYDPGLKKQAGRRFFEYQWLGDYHVRSMSLQVQQPNGADEMEIEVRQISASGEEQVSLGMGSGRFGGDGLVYYDSLAGEVQAGARLFISLKYLKPDDSLSFKAQPVQPSEPITPQTAGRTTLMGLVPWILGALGVLLIAGGAFWYWQSNQNDDRVLLKRHTAPPKEAAPAAGSPEAQYCYRCGKRAAAGDIYCRVCGTKLRIE